jgi:hypothetical protein
VPLVDPDNRTFVNVLMRTPVVKVCLK